MGENDTEQTSSQDRFRRFTLLQVNDCAFSWNLVCAIGYALIIYMFRSLLSWVPRNDAYYYFRRAAVRINDLLHVPLTTAVTTNAVARQEEGRWRWVGEELAVVISAICAALIILLFMRLIAKHREYRALSFSIACCLFAAPMCYLFISRITRPWLPGGESQSNLYSWGTLSIVLLAELIAVVIIVLLRLNRRLPKRGLVGLCVLHCGFWFPVLWAGMPDISHGTMGAHLLLIGFPLSVFTSLLVLRRPNAHAERSVQPDSWVWGIGAGLVALATLLTLWLPGWDYDLAQPRDMKSLVIEVSTGPCFGSCAKYRLTIHGNGLVEYVGDRYVNVHGPQTSTVSSEVYSQILKDLNDIRFFVIEDRAFQWGFDTPSVSVSVSVDGKFERIVSDAGFTGAKGGVQDRFVRAVREIEAVTGSDRWVKCAGRCRN